MRSLFIFLCLAAAGYGQVKAPKIGAVRYEDGSVRDIDGVSASYVIGSTRAHEVMAASFSRAGGIVAFADRLQVWHPDGSVAFESALSEPAALVSAGAEFLAWLPQSSTVLFSRGTTFARISVTTPPRGHVLGITMAGPDSVLLLSDSEQALTAITISLRTGDIVSERFLANGDGCAAFLNGFLVFHDERGLVIKDPAGAERMLPLKPANLTFERMAEDWLHVTSATSHQHWALEVTPKAVRLSELPIPLREVRK